MRSLGQIQEILCGCSRGHISCPIDLKIGQNVWLDEFLMSLGHLESQTRSVGQIQEMPCGCSRGHMFCSIDSKIGQNVCFDVTPVTLSLGHLCS